MIIGLIAIWLLLVVPCFAADTHYPIPADEQIKSWWKSHEQFRILKIYSLRLQSGEQGFLALIELPMRARCNSQGILLVRPALQEARQICPDCFVDKVTVLNHEEIDYVVQEDGCIAQGYTVGGNGLFYFDGWNPVMLHAIDFEEDSLCGELGSDPERPCHSESVTWVFTDRGDSTELVESIIYRDAQGPDEAHSSEKVNTYLIQHKQVVPVSSTNISGQSEIELKK